MKCTNAIKFHRKSGGAKSRDLQFNGPVLEMFSTERVAELSALPSVPKQRCHPDRSVAKWRDLLSLSATNQPFLRVPPSPLSSRA
jgi:hypothetical protein